MPNFLCASICCFFVCYSDHLACSCTVLSIEGTVFHLIYQVLPILELCARCLVVWMSGLWLASVMSSSRTSKSVSMTM